MPSSMTAPAPLTKAHTSPSLHALPHIDSGGMSLYEALCKRRSVRKFDASGEFLSQEELGSLCFAAQGETTGETAADDLGHEAAARRACPSGGSLYPLNLYVITRQVAGVPSGVYRFQAGGLYGPLLGHVETSDEDLLSDVAHTTTPHDADAGAGAALEAAAGFQTWVGESSAILLIAGSADKACAKGGLYKPIASDLVKLEAGMCAENVLLMAASLPDLGACPVAGFDADKLKNVLAVIGANETPHILIAVGRPAAAS